MRFQGHLAAGYIASQAFIFAGAIPADKQLLLTAVGSLAGVLPDMDAIYYLARKRELKFESDFRHHTWISHTFPPYLLVGSIVLILGEWLGSDSLVWGAALGMISVSIHLCLDMIGSGDGIMLAWPLSRRMVGIGKMNVHGTEWKMRYEASGYVWIERLILIAAAALLLSDLVGWR